MHKIIQNQTLVNSFLKLIILTITFIIGACHGVNEIPGVYRTKSDNPSCFHQIIINKDSTYRSIQECGMLATLSEGFWSLKNDTIIVNPKFFIDTLPITIIEKYDVNVPKNYVLLKIRDDDDDTSYTCSHFNFINENNQILVSKESDTLISKMKLPKRIYIKINLTLEGNEDNTFDGFNFMQYDIKDTLANCIEFKSKCYIFQPNMFFDDHNEEDYKIIIKKKSLFELTRKKGSIEKYQKLKLTRKNDTIISKTEKYEYYRQR